MSERLEFLERLSDTVDLLEIDVLNIQQEGDDCVNRIFRHFHTLKSGAKSVGLDTLSDFLHKVESVLSRIREKSLPISEDTYFLMLAVVDMLKLFLADQETDASSIVEKLDELLPKNGILEALRDIYVSLFDNIANPVPDLQDEAYRGFDMIHLASKQAGYMDLAKFAQETSNAIIGTDRETTLRDLPLFLTGLDGLLLTLENKKPIAKLAKSKDDIYAVVHNVKIPPYKLDIILAFMNDMSVRKEILDHGIGELNSLIWSDDKYYPLRSALTPVFNGWTQWKRQESLLYDAVSSLNMISILSIFNQFQRFTHDTANRLNKQVRLVVKGVDTEVDRNVVESVKDILKHLIRNSIDHGIEEKRKGKPEHGTITLNSFYTGNVLHIEVSDDGGGVNFDKVRAAAKKRGWKGVEDLSETVLLDILTTPGFSTSDSVSDISGRGVGLDVVAQNVKALHGNLSIASSTSGTTFSVKIPSKTSLLEGVLVKTGQQLFVIPVISILSTLKFKDGILIDGKQVDLVYLHNLLQQEPGKNEIVVLITNGKKTIGLVVDELLGYKKVKEEKSKFVDFISGSSVLGEGIAFVLDTNILLKGIQ